MNLFLSQLWWSLILRGALAVLFGLIAFLMPGIAITSLVLLFGAFAYVDGAILLVAGIRYAQRQQRRWWVLLLQGVIGIVVGIISWATPEVTALSLLYLMATWAVLTGVLEMAIAIRLWKEIEHEWLLGLSGLASTVLGVLFFLVPSAGLLVWIWMIGAYSLVAGALLLMLAFRVHRFQTMERDAQPHTAG